MKILIGREEYDINDDAGIGQACQRRAMQATKLIPNKQKNQLIEELLTAIHYGYIKAGAVLAVAEMRDERMIPRDVFASYVDYLRELVGEAKPRAEAITQEGAESGKTDTG